MNETDAMAAQLAELLTGSDRRELEEVVRRWRRTTESPEQQAVMEKMGDQILALKSALEQAPQPPTREELELALRMMLRLASGGGDPVR